MLPRSTQETQNLDCLHGGTCFPIVSENIKAMLLQQSEEMSEARW